MKRFGPLVAIVVVVGVLAAVALTRGGSDDADTATGSSVPGSSEIPVIYADAKEQGLDLSVYGEDCDPETGRLEVPSVFAPPCVPVFDGDNGGATYQGVTEDKIIIAQYLPAEDGDLTALLQGLLDPAENVRLTDQALQQMFGEIYETYGRTVELVPVEASGQAGDETAARADAIKVAEEIGAFASWGGPALATSYANELAARGVLCIGCGLSVPDSHYQDNAPYMWGTSATPEQFLINLGDFVTKNLLGRNAEWAGDEAMRDTERVFGVVHFEQEVPVFSEVSRTVQEEGARRGWSSALTETYTFDIAKYPERAQTIIAKMKDAGVSSIIFLGDPLMPIYLTEAATAQNYFPEWIFTGTVLTDTTALGRRYDQRQMAAAFGLSSLPARIPRDQGEAYRLHNWYFGEDPAATTLVQIQYPAMQMVWLGIHLAGPNLTPETFRDGMFNYTPSGGGPTTPHISFGTRGYFVSPIDGTDNPDYLGIDDTTIIFWDSDAEGPDESGCVGKGMWRYYDNGKRYMPGEMPEGDLTLFDLADTVTVFDWVNGPRPPASDEPPDYPARNQPLPYDASQVLPSPTPSC